jgi:hypothetical protein
MTKRVIQREEYGVENIIPDDVWQGNVLPFLYQESLWFWLSLSLVSKQWMETISKNGELTLRCTFSGVSDLFTVISSRFSGVVSLKTDASILDYINPTTFPSLRKLEITSDTYICKSYPNKGLAKVTSLTLCANVVIYDIDELVDLEYLSIMHFNRDCVELHKAKNLKNIKHLCLGSVGRFVSLVDPCLELMVPADRSALTYLETNLSELFKKISYTGRGRLTTSFSTMTYSLYEGWWKEGKRHGEGTAMCRGNTIQGVWCEDRITHGRVDYRSSPYYHEGSLIGGYTNTEGMGEDCDPIKKHGYGITVKVATGDKIYEGYFHQDARHGWGKSFKRGQLVYEGNWEKGAMSPL